MDLLGQLALERGRWGGGEEKVLYGLRVLRVPADPSGRMGEVRLRRAGKRLERAGVRRALVPEGFEGWLDAHGLRAVDPVPLLRAQSVPLTLELLRRRGRSPGDCVVALRGERVDREMERAALLLSGRVRRLVISAPRGGEELAERLRREWGIPVLPPRTEAEVAVCFSGAGEVPARARLDLCLPETGLSGMKLCAPGLPEGDRTDLPLLTALWEGGKLAGGELKIT